MKESCVIIAYETLLACMLYIKLKISMNSNQLGKYVRYGEEKGGKLAVDD
jgi:hypothetical protein